MDNYRDLDPVFHALADPTRRAVVHRLARGSAPVGELAAPFQMALPSFMKHLGVLEAAGLISSEKAGRVRTCHLNREKFEAAERWFDEQRAIWESRYSNLDALLTTLKEDDHEI